MSIEQNLADLTAAVNNLTAVLQSKMMAGAVGGTTPVTAAEVRAERDASNSTLADAKAAVAAKKAAAEKAASAAQPAATESSTTTATTDAAAGDKPIDFTSQIQKPIVAMAAGGKRTEALAILKELGAGKASEIKPADYARAVELIAKAG